MKIAEKNGKFVIVDFSEIEAYKIACQIEKGGIEFYKKMIFIVKREDVKKELEYLLKEEENHLKYFKNCLFEKLQISDDGFEEDDLLSYMDYGVFQSLEEIRKFDGSISSVEEALRLGVCAEKFSIKFYESCRDAVSLQGTKEVLQGIIDEENRHKEIFLRMIKG